ncbi:SpoIIE family protein phosphatase [Silvibacterium sp.]|uniref:SpoIIE family protein phosphatase n=1 Tax=Silvibacterium sp. TaxID=1964179 RepID=UPI0039E5525D
MTELPSTPLTLIDGAREVQLFVTRSPFTVGRMPGSDLLLEHEYISRRHAEIQFEAGNFILVDRGSRHGTFVNGRKVQRHKLELNDAIHFGTTDGPLLRFGVRGHVSGSTMRSLINQLHPANEPNTAIEKLSWFLEAARKLNDVGAVDQILSALVETTLELTRIERGFVLLPDAETKSLKIAVGRASDGSALSDEVTISHSAIQQAIQGDGQFIVTDTLSAETGAPSDSIIAQNIRTIICIPLRSRRINAETQRGDVLGILYLDNRLNPGRLTKVDNDLLKTIATEAAALMENAQLAIEEEHARRYREELNIAASIQQDLMAVQPPRTEYARIEARFAPCKEIGGDFYDAVEGDGCVYVVIADVSGKGVSAALLAQTLQGMVYAQLAADQPLAQIARALNRYICVKDISKYATIVIVRLENNGRLTYVNCGHVHPLLKTGEAVRELSQSNLPVGMIENADFQQHEAQLEPGTRLLLVTDGVTEAVDECDGFFGNSRLETAFSQSQQLQDIFASLSTFCGAASSADDCTLVEVTYLGNPASA